MRLEIGERRRGYDRLCRHPHAIHLARRLRIQVPKHQRDFNAILGVRLKVRELEFQLRCRNQVLRRRKHLRLPAGCVIGPNRMFSV